MTVYILAFGSKAHFSVECGGGTADGCDDFRWYIAAVISILIVLLL